MKQFYVPGFRAKGTEVTMDYDSKYSFIYKHEDSLKTRRQQDRCDKKKKNILVLKGCVQRIGEFNEWPHYPRIHILWK